MAGTYRLLLKNAMPSLYRVSAVAFGCEEGEDHGSDGREGRDEREAEEQPALMIVRTGRNRARSANRKLNFTGFFALLGV
jgi:hypothetical protein